MRYNTIGVLLAASIMAGCASMDRSECLAADWRTVGFEDGSQGKPETAIGNYRQDCAEHGVTPDLDLYRQGHRQGSERFCTRRNGFMQGKGGVSYQNSCAADLEGEFLTGYRDGQSLYDAQMTVNNARSAVDKQQRLLTQLEQEISVKSELLVEDGLVKDERLAILADIEALKTELVDAVYRLPGLERELQRAQSRLNQLNRQFDQYQ